jgi:hypothetical protein
VLIEARQEQYVSSLRFSGFRLAARTPLDFPPCRKNKSGDKGGAPTIDFCEMERMATTPPKRFKFESAFPDQSLMT